MTRARRLEGTGAAGLAALALLGACAGTNPTPERVTLPPGATFGAVADTLAAHRVIAHPRLFKLIARVRGVDRAVQAGVYQFPPGTTPWKVLDVLAKGAAVSQKFTVPEGLTILDVAALAAERLGLREDSVLAAAREWHGRERVLGFPVKSFEGFLQPETYSLPVAVRSDELVRIMAEGFKAGWEPGVDRAARLHRHDPAAAGDLRLDRRRRGAGRRRARDHRRRVPQPASDRDGAAGRPDRSVRHHAGHRQAEAAAVPEGLPVPLARTTPTCTRVCRLARSTRRAIGASRRRSIRPRCRISTSSRGRTAATCSPRPTPSTCGTSRRCGGDSSCRTTERSPARPPRSPTRRSPGDGAPAPSHRLRVARRGSSDHLGPQNPRHHRHPAPARRVDGLGVLRPHRPDRDARPRAGQRDEPRESVARRAPRPRPPWSSVTRHGPMPQ